MNSRSKKYYESRKAEKGDKKGSSSEAGYNEQNEKTLRAPKENPAPSKTQDDPSEDTKAEQDDTGGSNNSGERNDDN